MGYAHAACRVFVVAIKLEFADAPLGLMHVEVAAVGEQCHSGAVVTSVLKSSESVYQYRERLACADISYYSTHFFFIFYSYCS